MRSLSRPLLAGAGALILASCTAQTTLPDAAAARGKRVGIVSALGERSEHVYVGFTIFTNVKELEPDQQWKVDDFLEESAGAKLSDAGAIPVRAGTPTREKFRAFAASARPLVLVTDPLDLSSVLGQVREFGERERLDWIVLVTPDRLPSMYSGSISAYGGYGKWGRGIGTGCYASIRVTVVDAKDGRVVVHGTGVHVSQGADARVRDRRLGELDEGLRAELKQCILQSLDLAKDRALQKMGLA